MRNSVQRTLVDDSDSVGFKNVFCKKLTLNLYFQF